MTEFRINQILEYLPHRYPFVLIDRVLDFEPEKHLHAIKNITINEPFFTGHFPERPVLPGVMILEALAQASGVLALLSGGGKAEDGFLYYLAGLDKVRFKRIVEPGDQLHLNVNLMWVKREVWKYSCEASVDDELACSAEILSARRNINK